MPESQGYLQSSGLNTLLGQIDAVNAALVMNQKQTGSTEAAYEKMSSTTVAAVQRMNASFEVATRNLADGTLPAVERLADSTAKLSGPTSVVTGLFAVTSSSGLFSLCQGPVLLPTH